MFEFHGGGFLGEARTDHGPNLVHTGNVVYAYVNYRLGVLASWRTRRWVRISATTGWRTSRQACGGSSRTSPSSVVTRAT